MAIHKVKGWVSGMIFFVGFVAPCRAQEKAMGDDSFYLESTTGVVLYTGEDREQASASPALGLNIGYRFFKSFSGGLSYWEGGAIGPFGQDINANFYIIAARWSYWPHESKQHEFSSELGVGGGSLRRNFSGNTVTRGGFVSHGRISYINHWGPLWIGGGFGVYRLERESGFSIFLNPSVALGLSF